MKKIKVLIAEDSKFFVNKYKNMLKDEVDIQIVKIVKTSDKAVYLSKLLKPDVVLMDIFMPGKKYKSGIEATKIIKDECENIQVIILTSRYNTIVAEKALHNRCDFCASKDFLKDKVLADFIRKIFEYKLLYSELEIEKAEMRFEKYNNFNKKLHNKEFDINMEKFNNLLKEVTSLLNKINNS